VASYRYDCYGNMITMSGGLASANLYRFSSKEFMYNSGLYYSGYRFYDPNLQRWPNRDPLGEFADINLYCYAYCNPIDFIDPDGLWGIWIGDIQIGIGDPDFVFGDQSEPVPGRPGWVRRPYTGPVYGMPPDPPLGAIKRALAKVHCLAGKLPKGKPGKFGSPQRGTSEKGYRLDPPHPSAKPGTPETKPHINWWDWTKGKKGRGGRHGAIEIE